MGVLCSHLTTLTFGLSTSVRTHWVNIYLGVLFDSHIRLFTDICVGHLFLSFSPVFLIGITCLKFMYNYLFSQPNYATGYFISHAVKTPRILFFFFFYIFNNVTALFAKYIRTNYWSYLFLLFYWVNSFTSYLSNLKLSGVFYMV